MQRGQGTGIAPSYGGGSRQLAWECIASEPGSLDPEPQAHLTPWLICFLCSFRIFQKRPSSVVVQSNFSLILLPLSHKPMKVRTCSILQVGNQRPREEKRVAHGLELGFLTLSLVRELCGGGSVGVAPANRPLLSPEAGGRSSPYQANCYPAV